MLQLGKINHVGIRVTDLATTRAFYEKLGFRFVVGPVGPEPVAIMDHPGGIVINFILNGVEATSAHNVLMDEPEKVSGYTHMAMEVDDLDGALATLRTLDIPLSGGPVNTGRSRFAFVRDPDGNVLEIHQPNA